MAAENRTTTAPAAPASATDGRPVIRLRTPEDALAWVPYFVGFHPTESLVIVGFDEPDGRAGRPITMRSDLPPVDVPITRLMAYARHLTGLLERNHVSSVLLIAYSRERLPAGRIVRVLGRALGTAGIRIAHAMRADGTRRWVLSERDPAGRISIGIPYDLAGHPATTEAVYKGLVALADEQELRRSVAPVTGPERAAMLEAYARVLGDPAAGDPAEGDSTTAGSPGTDGALPAEGLDERMRYVLGVLTEALESERRLDDEEVARICVELRDLRVRDDVWAAMTCANAHRQVAFWRDIARRAVPPSDVAPSALLAFAAWLSGDGVLARVAAERALASDPGYGLAGIVIDILRAAIHPREWEPHPGRFAGLRGQEGGSSNI